MRTQMTIIIALFALGCGEKDGTSDDTSGQDDTAATDSKPEDSNAAVDDGRLRPGFWAFTVEQIFVNECGSALTQGDVVNFEVSVGDDGNHRLGPAIMINYGDPGTFNVNGLELRFRDDGDCQTDITVASSGTFTDFMHIDSYGRDENNTSTGADCADWAVNGGEDCRLDVRYSGEWISDHPPEE
ncbi:MAG: hypothetical protein H6741_23550 [Alphaproteobacteria bacterium]|nr:hypothetical protein [Alphaproteobacteria bacterium]MCB9795683.1 hypothetical protein [Alphaproteobacteria bacterium]